MKPLMLLLLKLIETCFVDIKFCSKELIIIKSLLNTCQIAHLLSPPMLRVKYLVHNSAQRINLSLILYAFVVGILMYTQVYWKIYNFEVIGYSDFDFGKCNNEKKSASWYIFIFWQWAILWKSHKRLTITFTMIAKYVTCYHAPCHVILLRNL